MSEGTKEGLTVSAWLHGGLDVADTLDGNAVLVVLIDIRVLELAHLIEEDAEFVGNIGDVIVASLSPDGELLLRKH